MAHHFLDDLDRVCASIRRGVVEQPTRQATRDRKRADGAEHDCEHKIEGMPHVGCNPDTRCDAGKREKKSNLESPEKVVAIKRTKEKEARRKQKPEAGILPAAAPCQLPDIEKADESEEPNHEKAQLGRSNGSAVQVRKKSVEEKEFDVHCAARKNRRIPECRLPFFQKAGRFHPIDPKMGCRRHP